MRFQPWIRITCNPIIIQLNGEKQVIAFPGEGCDMLKRIKYHGGHKLENTKNI